MDLDYDDEMADLQMICEFAKMVARQAGELVMEAIADRRKEDVFNMSVAREGLVLLRDQIMIERFRQRPHCFRNRRTNTVLEITRKVCLALFEISFVDFDFKMLFFS